VITRELVVAIVPVLSRVASDMTLGQRYYLATSQRAIRLRLFAISSSTNIDICYWREGDAQLPDGSVSERIRSASELSVDKVVDSRVPPWDAVGCCTNAVDSATAHDRNT